MQCREGGVDILQCIYCRGYMAVKRGGDILQRIHCRGYIAVQRGGEGVEQDLCKALAATNLCSADSQPLPCMRISIARRCTNYKDMHEDVIAMHTPYHRIRIGSLAHIYCVPAVCVSIVEIASKFY